MRNWPTPRACTGPHAGSVERGEQNISLTNIHEFAEAFGVPVADLFH